MYKPNCQYKWAQRVLNPPERTYWIVESSNGPSKDHHCRRTATEDDPIKSDFIGASVRDCQQWALEKQYQDKAVNQNIFVIADERTCDDDTVLVEVYHENHWDFGGSEKLPRETHKWYEFRVHYQEVFTVQVALKSDLPPDISYPIYHGRKEELTNEHGVFDVSQAEQLLKGGHPS